MRSVCAHALNRLSRLSLSSRRLVHSTPKMAEEYVEKLKENNPYYSKYSDKIAKLRDVSEDEVERRVQQKNQSDRVERDAATARSFAGKTPKPAAAAARPPQAKPKALNDVIKLELIQDKTSEEIGQLWVEYFKTKDSVSAVIPAANYQDLISNAKRYPTFLLPLPREGGYEFVVVQFAGNEAHFTALINYQTHKENAPECMAMVHYPELAESQGIVLMAAEYDSAALNASEAQCLANEVQLYYCRPDERRRRLVEKFSTQPDAFKYQELVQALEDVQL